MDQNELIDAYLRGERGAVQQVDDWIDWLLRREHRPLRREWEDLRQEVRARLFSNLSRGAFFGRATLRTYVHRITRNVCVDFVRRSRAPGEADADGRGRMPPARAEGEAEAFVARDLLDKLLDGLSEADQRLLHLVHVEQLSYAEVAAMLGTSTGAVKLRVFRCRQRLVRRLDALTGSGGEGS